VAWAYTLLFELNLSNIISASGDDHLNLVGTNKIVGGLTKELLFLFLTKKIRPDFEGAADRSLKCRHEFIAFLYFFVFFPPLFPLLQLMGKNQPELLYDVGLLSSSNFALMSILTYYINGVRKAIEWSSYNHMNTP